MLWTNAAKEAIRLGRGERGAGGEKLMLQNND